MSTIFNKAVQLLDQKKDQEFFYSFLHKNNKEYFDDSPGIDRNERLKASNQDQYSITGSMNTSLIDGYRQGVEITRAKHYFAGNVAKIHAAEPGHIIRKNFYGADRNFLKQDYFIELDYFNPIKYIMYGEEITYPLVTHDTDETENYNFNGVIEPFAIRPVAALYSIDVPFEAHSIKGMMMDGNQDITMSTSRILSIDVKKHDHRIQPWLDFVDMVGEGTKVPTMMFFNDDRTFINPFNDLANKVQLSTNLSDDMKNAVSIMAGSTENYVSENEISATCGWVYDDAWSKGTDSIAFGGLGY